MKIHKHRSPDKAPKPSADKSQMREYCDAVLARWIAAEEPAISRSLTAEDPSPEACGRPAD